MHPRLFHSLALLDPVASLNDLQADPPLAKVATFRKDTWPSRSHAEGSVKKSKFYSTWDPRVLDQLFKHGFRQGPTLAVPSLDKDAVTMVTSKHQEAFTIARANFEDAGVKQKLDARTKVTHPDLYEKDSAKAPFYRPEVRLASLMLKTLRPACLYAVGNKSPFLKEAGLNEKIEAIGTNIGGSGGKELGRVVVEKLKGGHFFPFESVDETSAMLSSWIQAQVTRSIEEEILMKDRWGGKVGRERQVVDDRWVKNISGWSGKTEESKL